MKYITILYFIGLAACTANDPKKGEHTSDTAQILSEIKKFEKSCNSLAGHDTANQLESLNDQLRKTLIRYKESVFQLPVDEHGGVAVIFSNDHNMAILSWNTYMGGTMQDYIALAFYRSGDSTGYFNIQYPGDEFSENSAVWYDTIASMKSGNHTYYLAHGFGRGSTALWWETVVAYEYYRGHIQRASIFPVLDEEYTTTKADTLSDMLFIELDTHFFDKKNGTDRPVISFIKKSSQLKVPITTPEGGNTNYYRILEFDGKKYQIQSTVSD